MHRRLATEPVVLPSERLVESSADFDLGILASTDSSGASAFRLKSSRSDLALTLTHDGMSPSRGKSVRNMIPGSWLIMSSGRALRATACGATPQAQKTGTSPG
jgi:hypothetical protein